jgi:hypothetical protein
MPETSDPLKIILISENVYCSAGIFKFISMLIEKSLFSEIIFHLLLMMQRRRTAGVPNLTKSGRNSGPLIEIA